MNSDLNTHTENHLKQWRGRAGLDFGMADQTLAFESGRVARYEQVGLARVPLCELMRIVRLYGVPSDDFLEAIEQESMRIRERQGPPQD